MKKVIYRPYNEMVASLFKEMGSVSSTLMHAAVGFVGEFGELEAACLKNDRQNALEELGDATFYIQKMLSMFGWSFKDFEHTSYPTHTSLMIEACEVMDQIKKYWVYNQPINVEKFRPQVERMMGRYFGVLCSWGFDLEEVQKANQEKLALRYPEGVYSDRAAQERADKAVG